MPLAPPVTTTTLPVTCMRRSSPFYSASRSLSAQHEVEHRGIMARRAEQDKAVPDRVLEAQPPPGMEDHAKAVEQAARKDEPSASAGSAVTTAS